MRAYFEFIGALSVLAGLLDWTRKGSQAEDDLVTEAGNLVIESLSNADSVGKIDCVTRKNLRDQVTLEEVIEIDEERRLRGFGWGRN